MSISWLFHVPNANRTDWAALGAFLFPCLPGRVRWAMKLSGQAGTSSAEPLSLVSSIEYFKVV